MVVITFNFTSGKYDVIGKDEYGEGAVVASYRLHSDALAERNRLLGNPREALI